MQDLDQQHAALQVDESNNLMLEEREASDIAAPAVLTLRRCQKD